MKRTALGAAAFVFALLLALASAEAQNTESAIKIGILTDFGGAYADVGGIGSVIAAEMAIQDFGGSVLGKPVRLISANHQGQPDVAGLIARRWFDVDGVDAIFDLSGSAAALSVQAIAASKKRITIVSSGSIDALTNEQCSPYGAHWTYDSYSIGRTLATLAKPGSTWFFITVDNAGGTSMQRNLTRFLEAKGAKVIGSVRHAQDTADISPMLLDAQVSGADYIALANAGTDLQSTVKQAAEFGLGSGKQTLIALVLFETDVKALGPQAAGGLLFPTGFVSDSTPEAEAWSKRFFERHKAMPNDVQAGVYSAVLHYLQAIQAAGTDNADAVMTKMRELPVNDIFAKGGILRKDGRMIHDMYLAQVKKPEESAGPWDLVKVVKVIPGSEAFRPLSESSCPLVRSAG